MLTNLDLTRPLAVLDLETTGTDPQKDRIVEISILRLAPGGRQDLRTQRVHPGMPIPAEASAVHGITDAHVARMPRWEAVAREMVAFLDGCDLCGFNIKRFDLRLLTVECTRAGLELPLQGRAIVDPLEIFHTFERRDLAAALRFYCGREHAGAHAAEADVLATIAVLDAQLGKYPELPRTAAGLYMHFRDANSVDADGRFTKVGNELRFTFGKYRGQPLHEVARTKPDYLEWILRQDFFDDAKTLVRQALERARSQEQAVKGNDACLPIR